MEAPRAWAIALLVLAPVAPLHADDSEAWWVVEYDGPVSADERAFLAATADPLLDHAPPFGYYARLSTQDREALEQRPSVVGVREVPVAAKASQDLDASTRLVRILAFPDASLDAFAAHLIEDGATSALSHPPMDLIDVELGALPIAHVLGHAQTRWVEPLREHAELDNARASSIVQTGTNAAWSVHDRGVNGSSQIVAYCDTGLDTDAPLAAPAGRTIHEQFADARSPLVQNVPSPLHRKVALYYAPADAGGLRGDLDDADGHGTHVAGTLAGDAGAWGARDGNDGVAYAARLAVCDAAKETRFQVLADYGAYWQPSFDVGARVHSNSWGTSPSNEYTLVARQHDAYAWTHRDFLILRSMGNAGPDGLMRPEAAAKNVLAIGATTNDATSESVAAFSARGPASDGRVKPDLVAPGACVTSADIAGAASYSCLNGTSHSTPVVAGAAALVRDYFAKGYHPGGLPNAADARGASSALVRAVMVASAARVASTTPDGAEGWGRPQLEDALAFEGDGSTLVVHDEERALETAEAWSVPIEVEAGSSLRIVLAWTDHPAAPGAAVALVNDLDLEVITPSGTILLGNADIAAPDRANVIERVLVDAAEAGEYMVRVRGWNVPMGPQPFALVAVHE